MHLGAIGVNGSAMVPPSLRYISVPVIVSVTSSVGLSVISVGSVGARAGAAMAVAILTLELALAATSKFGCMGLAGFHGVLKFLNQMVILVHIFQVTEKILSSVTKEADAVGFLAVSLGYLQNEIVFLGLLICVNQSVKVARLRVFGVTDRVSGLGTGVIAVGGLGFFLPIVQGRKSGNLRYWAYFFMSDEKGKM